MIRSRPAQQLRPVASRRVSNRVAAKAMQRIRSNGSSDTDYEDDRRISVRPKGNPHQLQDRAYESEPTLAIPRTRKAQETQARLGLGKPVNAGGNGPRVTAKFSRASRSVSGMSGKSGKSGGIMNFDTILEGMSTSDVRPRF
jgi:hypothetical protein